MTGELDYLGWMMGAPKPILPLAAQDWSAKAELEKRYLRRSDGRLEQVCEHGIGHTVAIDRVPYLERYIDYQHTSVAWRDAWWSHGCDGCCKNMERLHD